VLRRKPVAKTERPDRQSDASDYSATKAPENREHVESEHQSGDSSLVPGGAAGASNDVGMSSLERDEVPNRATRPEKVAYGENPAADRGNSGKE
jgi:hypothetical protein